MAQVIFQPANLSIEVPEGLTILQAARRANVVIEAPCNGNGTCGKCKVKVEAGPGSEPPPNRPVTSGENEPELVLACETVIQGDLRVTLFPSPLANDTLKILSQGHNSALEQKVFITKVYDPGANITKVYAGTELLGTETGDTGNRIYGLAVDIGTTTVVVSLVDLQTGSELEVASALNPQAFHAQDVLSRIKFATEDAGLAVLYSELIAEINRLIAEITAKLRINKEFIYEAVFSGNTCMLHLALNINPSSLGKHPYTPAIQGGFQVKSVEHNLSISKFGLIYLPPVISAYVGADITAGILAVKLHEQSETTLLVDIGTNGEMVLGGRGKLVATSTAAGPAFEGMNITFGMRAAQGAIERLEIDEAGQLVIGTIGKIEPIGICGSGLLDAVAELIAHEVVDSTGRWTDPEAAHLPLLLKERLTRKDGKLVFMINEKVWLTQKDIRQVQLAKSAVRAGIEFLMVQTGVAAGEIGRVLIAGSFGYHLQIPSLFGIGLLPPEFEGRVHTVGNTSKSGAQAFLLNTDYRREMRELVNRVQVIELADYPDFDRVFVKCMGF